MATRRRKECSSVSVGTVSANQVSGTGSLGTNGTALATSLPYPRTSIAAGESQAPGSGSGEFPLTGASSGSGESPFTGASVRTCRQATTTVMYRNEVTVTVAANTVGGSSPVDSPFGASTSTSFAGPFSSSNTSNGTSTATVLSQQSGVASSTNVVAPVLNAGSSSTYSSIGASATANSPVGTSSSAAPALSPVGSGSSPSSNSSSPVIQLSNSTSVNIAPAVGEFWAGATIGNLPRLEAIPGRVFYNFDGKTVKDPVQTLGDAGVNAFRLVTSRGQCLGPSHFVNNGSTLGDELLFELDWGCIDLQVKMAQRARAPGLKRFQLTINQGFAIPKELESFNYAHMVDNIKSEAKRQLQPFLDVGIVPDIILLENEGTDGFLMIEESTGHYRGFNDGKESADKVNQELCGHIPTGKMNSYPQYSGYLKTEINACNEAISAAGFLTDTTRYGLHSHGQFVQWKEGFVHGPDQHSQSELLDSNQASCSGQNPIPADILAQNATNMLTIMGFSAYPDPMTPADIYSVSSQNDTLTRHVQSLTQMQGYSDAWGKHTDGPFAGQYKLQSMGVEYSTRYTFEQISQEVALTELMFKTVKQFPAFLGMLWYEAWYCYSDWQGGDAALCHRVTNDPNITGEAPTDTLKTWGAQAVSPWK